ncbi:MAG: Slp family lipoprotein [Gammaproteobacteria bacterium]|nr:Slp family lipoprotein [Gammaproteobacteria bacterium]
MRPSIYCLLPLLSVAGLYGCATPVDIGNAVTTLSPAAVASNPAVLPTLPVAWGGTVISGNKIGDHIQLEVLAYPLDAQHRPQLQLDPIGRFIVIVAGQLDPEGYKPGREVTVVGDVIEIRASKLGELSVNYPLLGNSRVYLWSREPSPSNEPHFYFGIGVGLGH